MPALVRVPPEDLVVGLGEVEPALPIVPEVVPGVEAVQEADAAFFLRWRGPAVPQDVRVGLGLGGVRGRAGRAVVAVDEFDVAEEAVVREAWRCLDGGVDSIVLRCVLAKAVADHIYTKGTYLVAAAVRGALSAAHDSRTPIRAVVLRLPGHGR